MKKITVLGCGLVGAVMVRDLATDDELLVTAVDVSDANLEPLGKLERVTVRKADLSSAQSIAEVVGDADAVVGAVPGRIGFAMLEAVIGAGKPIADISFFPEDPLRLDALAKTKGVTAIVDCGVSPGLSNVAIGRAVANLDEVETVVIYVGGLPFERYWPFEYRSVFSPTDVIEEYVRPARMIVDGKLVVREALTEIEPIDFEGVGTLEAFNSDGLRTVLTTVKGRNMKEKTLRYPGHVDRMRMLRETGFFSDEPIDIGGVSVSPRRMTEKLMFEKWKKPARERELTVLRVVVEGRSGGAPKQFRYDLFDTTDETTGNTSMARTTGFPCAVMARMLARQEYVAPGIQPPELFGGDGRLYEKLIDELKRRGVAWREAVS